MQKKKLSPVQAITIAFAAVTLFGTVLLSMPFASRSGESVPMIDALFTATSASCVTGLAVYDTFTQWSPFGQAVLLLLIQIGGIGIVTLAMYFLSALHAKIGMRNVFLLQEAMGAESTAGLLKMTRFITAGVLLQEAVGALLLLPAFLCDFSFPRALWCAVFHSVSAFCNAGFDVLGGGSSMLPYSANAYVNIVLALLILLGGLGFFVWLDILRCRFRFARFSLHTKLVVVTSGLLSLGGTLLFFLLYGNSAAAEGASLGERLLVSFFQSVSARTAGFATVDLSAIGAPAQMLMIALMLVGGSSVSTAGGIKVVRMGVRNGHNVERKLFRFKKCRRKSLKSYHPLTGVGKIKVQPYQRIIGGFKNVSALTCPEHCYLSFRYNSAFYNFCQTFHRFSPLEVTSKAATGPAAVYCQSGACNIGSCI